MISLQELDEQYLETAEGILDIWFALDLMDLKAEEPTGIVANHNDLHASMFQHAFDNLFNLEGLGMGRRAGRKITREIRIARSQKKELHNPRENIHVTYDMMGPEAKKVIDRMFRDRSRAEYIANL